MKTRATSDIYDEVTQDIEQKNWRDVLDELFSAIREELIFDNLVVYQTGTENRLLDVLYAKSTGRGKAAEADASWGESLANRIMANPRIICEEPDDKTQKDRLASPYLLGIPIQPVAHLPGVIILIRFGGPCFTDEELELCKKAAALATSVIRKKLLDECMTRIDEFQAVARLQEDFINTISHELRSPLGFIKGYTTTLLRTDKEWDHEIQKDFLEIIERETNNLTDLIDDLLDSSRLQSGQIKFDFHAVRIDSLIRDEVNRTSLTHPEFKVTLDFEKEIPVIEGDSRKLAQVFDNLISNALKYAVNSPLRISLKTINEHLEIHFADSGPGIPEVYLPKLFTRFFRVPEVSLQARGSGLGLFICKQIIDYHQGSISASSSPQGTIFSIRLPLTHDAKTKTSEETQ